MSPPRTLSFRCALITGGGGGIGLAMAETLLARGKKIILAGRTESKLQAAVERLRSDRVSYYVLDTGRIADIPSFISQITSNHPELDCLINNAGVQRPLQVDAFDLAKADQEIDINIRGPMHLSIGLLPHFKSRPDGGVIMNVSSVLGFVPFSIINPVYNGTKAWLHFFTMNLRTQLHNSQDPNAKKIKVVEIAPPTVATDLHRDREDPDDNKKEKNQAALSVDEFMEMVVAGWEEDRDVIGAGMSQKVIERWYNEFGPDYDKAAGGT
ncbi:MAG: hypothetical protein M1817_004991 [Caeruleum heppii]|nr:MAG: hypothetical protein M1817_004991 [Caeruleum heppii]